MSFIAKLAIGIAIGTVLSIGQIKDLVNKNKKN